MAGLKFIAHTADIALTAGAAKTVLQIIAPTNHRVKLLGFGVDFDGISAVDVPVDVRVAIGSSGAGTLTNTIGQRPLEFFKPLA